jgi:hypothetical protein
MGRSATVALPLLITSLPESVTRPMTAWERSHLSQMAMTSFSRPFLATSSMRSCDSESITSYGVMPSSRRGTASMSITRPLPARLAISTLEEVSPAAPMSWMPTSASVLNSSRQASSKSFSRKGSPTCTVGRFDSLSSSNSALAMVAPWMPSRPVRAPM